MFIEDIRPGGTRPAPQKSAIAKARQIHHATKLSTIINKPPQIRPELRKFSSFDIIPAKPKINHKPVFLSDIRPQRNHPRAVEATRTPNYSAKMQPKLPERPLETSSKSIKPQVSVNQNESAKRTERYSETKEYKKQSVWQKLLDFIQYPLIALVALLAAYNSTAGQIMLGVYALFAIMVKISSKYTFGAALLLLIAIPTFQTLGVPAISERCAIYAYELLVIGTLQAIIETWIDNRRNNKVKHTTSRA